MLRHIPVLAGSGERPAGLPAAGFPTARMHPPVV
ncbi:hypothetical protein A4G23_01487 [Streptomyces rubrolavendulae]|uniref:Uncharacterized protein n=1 Tax=Streptomyces rubrolavendulae TaxID=285473 RepID=A0A1D8FZP6_9ACTN|nr:hypothetical protein A4G23_01487 [Streptomyces rubrolavendulae]